MKHDLLMLSVIKLLMLSILHWIEICNNVKAAAGRKLYQAENCPFCRKYLSWGSPGMFDCVGCPVYEHTGHSACIGTPWKQAARSLMTLYGTMVDPLIQKRFLEEDIAAAEAACRRELAFLVDLLPDPKE